MLKNFTILFLLLFLVSCFDSNDDENKDDHTTGGIITTYRQVSDKHIKTSSYFYTGILILEVDTLYYNVESDIDTLGYNAPYLEMNSFNTIWYREFDVQERMKSKAVSGDASAELYIDTLLAADGSDSIIDTIRTSLSNDTLYEAYTRSYWKDTLGVSYRSTKKTGVRTYVLVEDANIREMWQEGVPVDSTEPDSEDNPIEVIPVNSDLDSENFSTSSILTLSTNDTDFFKVPCVAGKVSLAYINTNMKTTAVAINGVNQLKQITVNSPQEGFELLSVYEVPADGFYNLSLSGNEGLYQLLIIEGDSE